MFWDKGYIPQKNKFFRPEIWLSFSVFSDMGLSLDLKTGYFPTHNEQDDFSSVAVNLGYSHKFTSKLKLSSSLLFIPSFIMVLQKGQAAATIDGLVLIACSVLSILMSLFPFSGSLNI